MCGFEQEMVCAGIAEDRDKAFAALASVAMAFGVWQDTWQAKSITEVGDMLVSATAAVTPDAPLLKLVETWRKEAAAARVGGYPLGVAGMAERHAEELEQAITHGATE